MMGYVGSAGSGPLSQANTVCLRLDEESLTDRLTEVENDRLE
jgi:hypothetical protein